jgi:hypothetical protein
MTVEHITIYRETGHYAGWPANYGIWSWGAEIVVGFTRGYHQSGAQFHTRDMSRPFVTMQARSLDGGETWQTALTPCRVPGNRGLSADEHVNPELAIGDPYRGDFAPVPCPGGVDFRHPDFALMCARTGLSAGAKSWFYTSYDRCQAWNGPFALPDFDQPGIAARTDYVISSADECTLFLTAAKADGHEGRVFCAQTSDGGRSFRFLAWIGPEPRGFAIMPASVRLSAERIAVAVRCQDRGAQGRNWLDLYQSNDDGRRWEYLTTPVEDTGRGGNPPAMIRLAHRRLCLVYGYRNAPYGLRARLSEDDGQTWGGEIILRDDGGCHDLGYPRIVQRPDGIVVAVYYHNDAPDGERYLAATLWRP